MYCPRCGTRIDDFPCSVCGATSLDQATGGPATAAYAGWWLRVAATFFDNLILFVPNYAAFLIGDSIANVSLGALFGLIVQGLYAVMLIGRPAGQTIGNRIVGTRVRDATTGASPDRSQAFRRWLLMGLYTAFQFAGTSALGSVYLIALIVDCLYPLFNAKKQTWHDRFANTVVLRG
ncbi:MAG: RDD family protein [Acidimicrobiales bacterium]